MPALLLLLLLLTPVWAAEPEKSVTFLRGIQNSSVPTLWPEAFHRAHREPGGCAGILRSG
jgi:hypothetical protein